MRLPGRKTTRRLGASAALLLMGTAASLLTLSPIGSADTEAVRDESGFARAVDPREFRFPADDGSHEPYKTEWWYLTGCLEDDDGNLHGFQATWFRVALEVEPAARPSNLAARNLFFFHGATTDVTRKRFTFAQKAARGASNWAGAESGALEVFLLGNRLRSEANGSWRLRFHVGDREFDLRLTPRREPLLHGESPGLSAKGPEPGQASYYYSRTRLRTEGTLRPDEDSVPIRVTGTTWFDHEFGSNQLAENQVGWDWFSVPLDDGTDLMLYSLRRKDGSIEPASSGTLRTKDGRRVPLRREDFRIEPIDRWESERSGGDYPSRWKISVPSHSLELEVVPLLADQELRTRGTTGVNYWEGMCEFRGLHGEDPVTGRGYVELVGYAGDFVAGI
jgi:predicted secreted hydrolase